MLNAYVKRPLTRERYRSRPAGPHLDAFILWLEQRGYHPRRILRLIRGVHRFSQWAQENGRGGEELDAQALAQFRDHLQSRQPLRYPSGSYRPVILGARHFVTFLATLGLVSPTAVVLPSPPEPALLGAFRQWMHTHRGTTEATLNTYRLPSSIYYTASVSSPPPLKPKPSGPFSSSAPDVVESLRHKRSSKPCACFSAFSSPRASALQGWSTRCRPLRIGA